jgi:adenylate cyclase
MAERPTIHPHADLLMRLHLTGGAGVVGFTLFFLAWGNPLGAITESGFLAALILTYLWLRTKGTGAARIAALHIGLLQVLVGVLTWSMGGLLASGSIALWAIISPLAAMMFLGRRGVLISTAGYVLLLAATWLMEPTGPWVVPPPEALRAPLTAINLLGGSLLALLTLGYFHGKLHAEQRRADNLLLNMLPEEIAETLKRRPGTIAEQHEGASILFADIVGFTPMCRQLSPTQMVDVLNEVFSRFDELAAHYGVEKIKTIGDCYMVAAGVPREDPQHAKLLAAMALEMVQESRRTLVAGEPLQVRVGISSGPVVAGVIGQRKFIYDLWGDAVNLASRMESHGATDQVRVTGSTLELIEDAFACTSLGRQAIKGVGEIEVWRVEGWLDGVVPLPRFRDGARKAG